MSIPANKLRPKIIQGEFLTAAESSGVTARRVLTELAAIGFADPRELFGLGGELLDPLDWPDHVAASIQSIRFRPPGKNRGGESEGDSAAAEIAEIRFWPKATALQLLAQHLRLLGDAKPGTVDIDASDEDLDAEITRLQRSISGLKR